MTRMTQKVWHRPAPLRAALVLAVLPAWLHSATIPFPRRANPPILLSMPTANVLSHYQYMLSGRFQYFTTSVLGDTASAAAGEAAETKNMTYNGELLLGVENRAELGVQYGSELSLSLKALLVREDVFWPDLVFGVRNVLGSPEGGLYGVTDEATLETLYGESFATAAKSFPSASRVHVGFSYLNGANKNAVGLNLGLEQDLGAGAWLGYEVFERFSDFHQVLSLSWRYKEMVALSLGLTEFQSWIRQDGEWGFFLAPSESNPTGYNSPGITLSLQVLGFAPRRQKRTVPERVAILEVRNVELEKRLLEMQEAMARLEASGSPAGPAAAPARDASESARMVRSLLKSAAESMAREAYDPGEVRQLMIAIVTAGPEAAAPLRAAAADTAAGDLRIPALLTMAFSRDSAHAPALRLLLADKDARIRREALTALTKVQPAAALEEARRLIADPDETVALAAGEAYRMLGGEPLPEPAAKVQRAAATAPKPAPRPAAKSAAKANKGAKAGSPPKAPAAGR
jgi:hypothetical protein